jgi:hypothetical protein
MNPSRGINFSVPQNTTGGVENQRRENSQSWGPIEYLCVAYKELVRFGNLFPNPMVLDAVLRFTQTILVDKVSTIFGRIIPFAFPLWSGISFVHVSNVVGLSLDLCMNSNEVEERRENKIGLLMREAANSVAVVANTILWAAGVDIETLAQSIPYVGLLPYWKEAVFSFRDIFFFFADFLIPETYSTSHSKFLSRFLNCVVTMATLYTGYTFTVGALAAISCAMGVKEMFRSSHTT